MKLWQVDAFSSRPLEGNSTAIVPLESWLPETLMRRIAVENNLSETTFLRQDAPGRYEMRWIMPDGTELDLCGHATLAAAWAVFRFLEPGLDTVLFQTRGGELKAEHDPQGRIVMSLPVHPPRPFQGPDDVAAEIGKALSAPPPRELHKGNFLMAVWDDSRIVRGLAGPGGIATVLRSLNEWGLIVTAPGDKGYDFISRFFVPSKPVPEDAVTGSSHCVLTPFWAKRLGKKHMTARQVSPRGGDLHVTEAGGHILVAGDCALYLTGEIQI